MQTIKSYISLTSLPLPEFIGGSSRSFQKQSDDVGQDQRGQPGGRGGQGEHGWFCVSLLEQRKHGLIADFLFLQLIIYLRCLEVVCISS